MDALTVPYSQCVEMYLPLALELILSEFGSMPLRAGGAEPILFILFHAEVRKPWQVLSLPPVRLAACS